MVLVNDHYYQFWSFCLFYALLTGLINHQEGKRPRVLCWTIQEWRLLSCAVVCASVSKPNTVIFQSCLPCCPPCPLPLWQVPIHQFRTNLLYLRDGPKRLTKNNSDIINYPSDTMSQRSTVKRVAKYLEAHQLFFYGKHTYLDCKHREKLAATL